MLFSASAQYVYSGKERENEDMVIEHAAVGAVLGLGHDVVDVPAFVEQLNMPGSTFKSLFSVRERRQSEIRAQLKGDGENVHLAARWAGKEAVIKAWEEALGDRPSPYSVESIPWAQIEILDDSRGRPHVVLAVAVEQCLRESVGRASRREADTQHDEITWHLSLSHDGTVASAVAICALPPVE